MTSYTTSPDSLLQRHKPEDVELHKEQKMWPFDSRHPPADRSALERVTCHKGLLDDMLGAIADTAKALIVVSGLKSRAFIGRSDDVWWRFRPPRGDARAKLLQQYSLAAEQGLDHFQTLQLVCEMGYILTKFQDLTFMLGNEQFGLECVVNARVWPPPPLGSGSASSGNQHPEIGLASVEKWNCIAAREEDLQLWQAEVADVIDRATEMLRGKMDNVGRAKRDSTTLRRRR